jgi:hypothetical protein
MDTYEGYVQKMNDEIDRVMNHLYLYQPNNESSTGLAECGELARLVMNLGVVSDVLRPVLKNNIPTQYEILDQWFQRIDIEKLDTLFGVGLLRFTFVAKDHMKEWKILRDKMSILLEKRGRNPQKVLRGLF